MSEYTDKMHSPSPAHGGTSAMDTKNLNEILSVFAKLDIPDDEDCWTEPARQAQKELAALTARLAALTRENEQLRARAEKARGDCIRVLESQREYTATKSAWLPAERVGRINALDNAIVGLRALAHDEGRGTNTQEDRK